MLVSVVDVFLLGLLIYVIAGVLFSAYFMIAGIAKLDEGVEGSPWHFKLIIWPGVVMLWLVLLIKLIRR